MKPSPSSGSPPLTPLIRPALALAALLVLGVASSPGQAVRSQTITLTPGWNAVYLEVDPQPSSAPADLFAELPVDVVAAYAPSKSGAQFVTNPDANLHRAQGWLVWYAPHRADAFLGTLNAIYGARAYLIHATTNASFTVQGTVPSVDQRWIPKAYNFVGFTVASPGGPTFKQFFQSSTAHNHNKIYRLVEGTWRQVLDPSAATMRPGEAFWIYCDGHSSYTGPLGVEAGSHLGLLLSSQGGDDLVLRNRANHPLAVTLEHIVEGNSPIPMSVPVRTFDPEINALRTAYVNLGDGAWSQTFPTFEAGKALRLPLQLRLREMEPGTRHSLLALRTDLGTVTYVSVTATRDD